MGAGNIPYYNLVNLFQELYEDSIVQTSEYDWVNSKSVIVYSRLDLDSNEINKKLSRLGYPTILKLEDHDGPRFKFKGVY